MDAEFQKKKAIREYEGVTPKLTEQATRITQIEELLETTRAHMKVVQTENINLKDSYEMANESMKLLKEELQDTQRKETEQKAQHESSTTNCKDFQDQLVQVKSEKQEL